MGSDAPLIDIAEDKLIDFDIEVMTIPQYDTEEPKMISQGPSICIFNKEDSGEVLASWLFVQYMLTNDVQIGYATTEGYVPVTTKAQESDEYTDYLSRKGEDNQNYYSVKIEATELLLDNIDNTFVTSVFNGSASLRDAAGQLIEGMTKAARRGTETNEEYIDSLFDEVSDLYRLDQIERTGGKANLGELPVASVVLLTLITATWIIIILYVVISRVKSKKSSKNLT